MREWAVAVAPIVWQSPLGRGLNPAPSIQTDPYKLPIFFPCPFPLFFFVLSFTIEYTLLSETCSCKSSQPHRYLFLLFREPHGLALTKDDVGGEEFVQRRSFDAVTFIAKHQLRLVSLNWMKGAGDGWKE